MNYDKLSRSLRYYYEKGIMQKVRACEGGMRARVRGRYKCKLSRGVLKKGIIQKVRVCERGMRASCTRSMQNKFCRWCVCVSDVCVRCVAPKFATRTFATHHH